MPPKHMHKSPRPVISDTDVEDFWLKLFENAGAIAEAEWILHRIWNEFLYYVRDKEIDDMILPFSIEEGLSAMERVTNISCIRSEQRWDLQFEQDPSCCEEPPRVLIDNCVPHFANIKSKPSPKREQRRKSRRLSTGWSVDGLKVG